jgi:hypothetical protein
MEGSFLWPKPVRVCDRPADPRAAQRRAFSSDGSATRRTRKGVASVACAALGVAERGGGEVVRTTDVWGAPPTHERRTQARRGGGSLPSGRGRERRFGAHCVSMILPQVHLRNGERLCGRWNGEGRETHARSLSLADCVLSPPPCGVGTHRRSVCELARRPRGRGWLQIVPRVLRERAGCDHTRGLLLPRPRGGFPFAWYRLRFEGLLRSWAMSRRTARLPRALAFKPLGEAPPCALARALGGRSGFRLSCACPVEGNKTHNVATLLRLLLPLNDKV